MEVLKVDFKKIKGVFRDVKKIEVGAWNDEEEGFFNLVVKGTTREGGEKYLIVHVERVPREEVEVRKEWWRRVKYSVGYDWRVIEVKFFEWDGEVWERVIAFKEYGAVIVFGDVDGVEREDWVKDMVDDFVVGWGTDYMDWLRGKQDRST
ncbi:hypothetical protein P8X24_10975 [Pyrococcus kukulkanii]|uniref:hypothetical protein n=1 Tax=Pyrococcus kukulkanii TaxID=1609559 RepID=UPI003565CADA